MVKSALWRRAWRAILSHALLRWESAVTIALAIVAIGLFPRPFALWQWWYWLIIFAAAEALIIWTSITDARTGERVVTDMLRQRFDPSKVLQTSLRTQFEQALQYRQALEVQIGRTRKGVLRDRLTNVAGRVDEWMLQIGKLAERLDQLGSNSLIQTDAKETPEAITRYRSRLHNTQDEQVRQQLQSLLASKETQQANLQELARTMERGQLQLENTVSDLGIMYSQFVLLEARDIDSGRLQRLSQDIDEQVAALADVVQTLDELYKKSSEA